MDMIHKLAANAADAWQQVEATNETYLNQNPIPTAGNEVTLEKSKETDKDGGKNKDKDKDSDRTQESGSKPAFVYTIRLVKFISNTQECNFTAGRFEGESVLLEERSVAERRRRTSTAGFHLSSSLPPTLFTSGLFTSLNTIVFSTHSAQGRTDPYSSRRYYHTDRRIGGPTQGRKDYRTLGIRAVLLTTRGVSDA